MLARTVFALQGPTPRPQTRFAGKQPPLKVTSLALPGQQADGFLLDGETLRNLSPEARQVFQEAQDNILEINKGRIRALEELKSAKRRIAELEQQLQEALMDANQAAAQVAELQSVTNSFATYDAPPAQQAPPPPPPAAPPAYQPEPQPAYAAAPEAAAPPAPAAPPSPPPIPTVTIVYETSWDTAFIHYNADGKGWTQTPGNRMVEGAGEFAGKKVLDITCNRVEFVATNGKNDWDHPDQFESGGTKNYVITTPGVYRLKSGKVAKMT